MIILKVIHGYPMRFNAGSEVYSQNLCHRLVKSGHQVHVFTREENIFKPDYEMHEESDSFDNRIRIHVINMPRTRMHHRYRHKEVDALFAQLLNKIQPHIVHVGHLNHLSSSILKVVYNTGIPIVFTLHDYWLMCPRGQFLQRNSQKPLGLCDGQDNKKCATRCFTGFFAGGKENNLSDIAYWTSWVGTRMDYIKEITNLVDMFIAPSRYLLERFRVDFGLDKNKLTYLDYGFNLEWLKGRKRLNKTKDFVFGYIGTHIPAKGIQDLLLAFSKVKTPSNLKIWGRAREETDALKAIEASLSEEKQSRIEWKQEYQNCTIVKDVFNHIDALVVPSIWVENSPLVIHEALQVRLPVITANVGGMSEYVHHEVNGLLFQHRCTDDLAIQMEKLASNLSLAIQLGSKGYLQSENGDIPGITQHVKDIEDIYKKAIKERGNQHVA